MPKQVIVRLRDTAMAEDDGATALLGLRPAPVGMQRGLYVAGQINTRQGPREGMYMPRLRGWSLAKLVAWTCCQPVTGRGPNGPICEQHELAVLYEDRPLEYKTNWSMESIQPALEDA